MNTHVHMCSINEINQSCKKKFVVLSVLCVAIRVLFFKVLL